MKAALMAPQFAVDGRLVRVTPIGRGNVNDTYLAIFRTTFSEERFVLQRLNRHVFTSPDSVMHNMKVVTEHVHRRLSEESHKFDRIWQLPRIIPAKNSEDYIMDANDGCWRAISLIASAHSHEEIQSLEHAHEAGFVLGQFQRLISDIPIAKLEDTLPGFHMTPGYLAELDEGLGSDEGIERLQSLSAAEQCLTFIQERRDRTSVLEDARERGELHLRPIHGDPKVSNVLIDDETGRGTCMIDLDTVKPGLVHYDFGDCLRSCCNPAGEETLDLTKVYFDEALCKEIVRGYMTFAREFFTESDLHYQYDAIWLIAFELGIRFFTDFIRGDRYFKTKYEGQNLNRALVQLKLCESIERRECSIRKVLEQPQHACTCSTHV